MINDSWFWENWKTISKVEGITPEFGLLILLLIKDSGISNSVEITDDKLQSYSELLGVSSEKVRKNLNTLVKTKILSHENKSIVFPEVEVSAVNYEKKVVNSKPTDDEQEIFTHWIETMKSAKTSGVLKVKFTGTQKLTSPRLKSIRTALKSYDKKDIVDAISGSLKSEYHMKEGHIDFSVLLRHNSTSKRNNIEHFRDLFRSDSQDGKWNVSEHNEEDVL